MGFFELVAARFLMRVMLYAIDEIHKVDRETNNFMKSREGILVWIVDEQDEDVEKAIATNIFKKDSYTGYMGDTLNPNAIIHFKTALAAIQLMRGIKTIDEIRDAGQIEVEGDAELVRSFIPLMQILKEYMEGIV